jgi:glycosyltransferase involved in cell wall biosynthesis
MDISVAIPTYNGAQRFPQVLDRLQEQIETSEINWEVVVVDNNSDDQTARIVKEYQEHWTANCPLRYVFESQQGLAFARQRAVDITKGELIAFLDDDNWPATDWVFQAFRFGRCHPQAGAYGGKAKGYFETEPQEDISQVQRFLVIRDYGSQAQPFEPQKLKLPAGAGLVVRREAWLEAIPRRLTRVGDGGDDYEISLRMHHHGWEIWYAPALKIQHFIPTARLERSYLSQLTHKYGLCTFDLVLLSQPEGHYLKLFAKTFLGSAQRIIKHLVSHGFASRKSLSDDCMLSFHVGNLKSPFIHAVRTAWGRLSSVENNN